LNQNKKLSSIDKAKLKCTHCGGSRHVKEGCFKFIGYPNWWKDPKRKNQIDNRGRVAIVGSVEGGVHMSQSRNQLESKEVADGVGPIQGGIAGRNGASEVIGSSCAAHTIPIEETKVLEFFSQDESGILSTTPKGNAISAPIFYKN
jgi:hypothetical protein